MILEGDNLSSEALITSTSPTQKKSKHFSMLCAWIRQFYDGYIMRPIHTPSGLPLVVRCTYETFTRRFSCRMQEWYARHPSHYHRGYNLWTHTHQKISQIITSYGLWYHAQLLQTTMITINNVSYCMCIICTYFIWNYTLIHQYDIKRYVIELIEPTSYDMMTKCPNVNLNSFGMSLSHLYWHMKAKCLSLSLTYVNIRYDD